MQQKDLDNLFMKGLSKNTESKCKCTLNLFVKWQQDRKKRQPNADSFKDIMIMCDEEIDRCLSFFVAEVRNKSGEDYKPKSLYEIICSIQHHMRKDRAWGRFICIFDDKTFQRLRSVLDSKMKELSSRGLGLDKKRTEVI